MSVPKSHRTESSMLYIENARKLYIACTNLSIRLPKTYTFYINKRLSDVSFSIFSKVCIANRIYVNSEESYNKRRIYLEEANGLIDSLQVALCIAKDITSKVSDEAMTDP